MTNSKKLSVKDIEVYKKLQSQDAACEYFFDQKNLPQIMDRFIVSNED
jgi:hypothetical protein